MLKSVLSILIVAIAIVGCRRDSEPPPRVVSSDLGLMPLCASDVIADSVFMASATTEESARGAAVPAAAIPLDDSTPEGLAKGYVELINGGLVQQLTGILMADQQAAAAELVPVIQPLLEANAKLHRLLAEKFAGHAFQIGLSHELLPPDWLKRWTVVLVTPDPADANTATAALQEEGGTQTVSKTFKKVDEHWRVQETGLPPAGSAAQAGAAFAPIAEALQAVATRIDSNELTDAQQVETEIKQALTATAAAPTAEAPAAPAAPAQPAPANAATPAPKNNDHPKSELENDVDNAAMRSTLAPGL